METSPLKALLYASSEGFLTSSCLGFGSVFGSIFGFGSGFGSGFLTGSGFTGFGFSEGLGPRPGLILSRFFSATSTVFSFASSCFLKAFCISFNGSAAFLGDADSLLGSVSSANFLKNAVHSFSFSFVSSLAALSLLPASGFFDDLLKNSAQFSSFSFVSFRASSYFLSAPASIFSKTSNISLEEVVSLTSGFLSLSRAF